jgi:hypothetical protein
MGRYAICRKAKIFKLFDEGKRPADIAEVPVTRKTLYQYYYEWRREKNLPGRQTGFAIKKFDRKAYLSQKKEEELRKEKEGVMKFASRWEVIAAAMKNWDGESPQKINIPGVGYRWLSKLLKYKVGTPSPVTKEEIIAAKVTTVALLEKWVELAKRAANLTEFRELCKNEAVGSPAEIGRE